MPSNISSSSTGDAESTEGALQILAKFMCAPKWHRLPQLEPECRQGGPGMTCPHVTLCHLADAKLGVSSSVVSEVLFSNA